MKTKKIFLLIIVFWGLTSYVFPQNIEKDKKIIISGKIYSEVTSKPVEFGTIAVLEIKKKFHSDADGSYSIEFSKPGMYTFLVSVEGLKTLDEKIEVKENTIHNFIVSAVKVTGRSLTVRSARDIQKVSRYSMTSDEIKDVPAAFGDIVQSLTSLPGITSQSFFNSIIMRGADSNGNYYSIDNIPILDPRHFLGLHTKMGILSIE